MSFLFIAHDLKVACYFCDRIGVMYKGELMEEAPAANLYKEALHPYTRLLFSSAAGISQEEAHTEAQGHGEYGRNSEEAHAHQSNAPEPVRAFLEKNLHGVGQENLSLSNKGFRPQAQGRRERKGDSEVLISKSNSHGNAETQENNSLSSTSAPSRLCVMDSQEKASNSSCSFAPRCTRATERCFCEHPALCEVSSGHSIRCFNCAS
jgi:ABC-type dipeptide/oligopeptide/nickel transport system ATPase component